MMVHVGEAVAGKERPAARVVGPQRRHEVFDRGVDQAELCAAEVDCLAALHRDEAIGELWKEKVVVADVAHRHGIGIAVEDAAEVGSMGDLCMGGKDVFDRGTPAASSVSSCASMLAQSFGWPVSTISERVSPSTR